MLVNGKMTSSAYQSAGVDLQGIESLKERIGAFASLTHGPEVLKGVGAFAGLYRLRNYKNPVLAASTDGVGTKMKVASLLGHYESLGIDLVNLNVNDIVTCGAHPLLFLDYISLGKLDPQIVEPLLRGMVWACREVDCALVGGETAQMPGLYADGEFDLAGTVVGAVEESAIIDGSDVVEGDILLGLPSSGLHTNGFSLVRKVFDIDDNPSVLYQQYQDLGHSLGEELIKPHQKLLPNPQAPLRASQGSRARQRRRPAQQHPPSTCPPIWPLASASTPGNLSLSLTSSRASAR